MLGKKPKYYNASAADTSGKADELVENQKQKQTPKQATVGVGSTR